MAVFDMQRIGDMTRTWTYPSTDRNGSVYSACLFIIALLIVAGGMFPAFASAASPAPSGDSLSFGLGSNPLSKLWSRGKQREPPPGEDLLPPDEAFPPPHLELKDPDTLVIRWRITKGYYLYRDGFRFGIKENPGLKLGLPQIPRGIIEEEEDAGRVEVFLDEVAITLPIIRHASAQGPSRHSPRKGDVPLPARTDVRTATENNESATSRTTTLELIVGYQGCAKAGLCYPPFTKTLPVELPALGDEGPWSNRPTTKQSPRIAATAKTALPEPDRLARVILRDSLWIMLPIFFGFGLLLGLTPCVFPMIPILAGIIAGQGKGITTGKAFALSVTYVLAMAIAYTIAGVIAGLSGHNLQAAFQEPWIITAFSAIFVLLALSMFGLVRFQIPASWQTKLTMLGNLQEGGTFAGVATMGLLSALIVGPCVAPPLAGALIAIGSAGDPMRGGLALFSLSIGMGAPLIVMGASAGRWLPKAGPWMRVTNYIFGVLLLAVAIYLLERILPGWVGAFLWGVLSIMIGTYLGASERLQREDSGWRKFRKGMGIVAMVYGIVLMVSASAGLDDRLLPLEGFIANSESKNHAPLFERVETPRELQARLTAVSARNYAEGGERRLTMLDYYADWCIECKRMDARTFSDPSVGRILANMVLLRADVTDNDQQDQAMLRAFGLYGPPAILFFGPDGKEYSAYRIQGFMEAKEFREHVRRVREVLP
uniref:Thiol:disulfide interchange protein DsbD n=1 Tax=Candidatus Kentrum sp. TC TaxID=2126339 RepID=A0A450ZMA6_9GAMM|nr:MAG: thiol:disulfide interchange protein DsbD [Candidatus Kentron sp. TC]